ncbi:MAG: START domain-containing protein [Crocinitomicaceae bacterium]|nr:hypothetical protein [Crocinitomicaceae bacterium]
MKSLLATSIFLITTIISFSADWSLEKNKDGIKVYTREVAGSDIKEYKAFATINADRIEIAKVLTRVGDFQNWMPNVEKSRMVRKVSSTSLIAHYTVDLPWPADNRDIVLNLDLETDNEKGVSIVRLKENLSEVPEDPDYIRMKKASGYWKLTSNGSQTDIIYQFHADPGGSLPTSLINFFIVDGPYDAIQALKKKVE